MKMLAVAGLSKRFGGFLAVNQVSFEVRQGEILGLIGPNGSGKSTTFNLIAGTLRPSAARSASRARRSPGLAAHTNLPARALPAPSRSRGHSASSRSRKRGDRRLLRRGRRHLAAPKRSAAPRTRSISLGCRPTQERRPTGSALPHSKSSNSPARSRPSRGCCLPTRASAGSMRRKWSVPPICSKSIRSRMGITIIWVEHIMGVLMRIVDRVIVLDHGEKIFEGAAARGGGDARVDRGLSRQGAARERRCCRCPGFRPATARSSALFDVSLAVDAGEAVASSAPTAPARPP